MRIGRVKAAVMTQSYLFKDQIDNSYFRNFWSESLTPTVPYPESAVNVSGSFAPIPLGVTRGLELSSRVGYKGCDCKKMY